MCVTVNVIMPVAVTVVNNCKTKVRIEYIAEMGPAAKKMAAQFF
jgi:hypothetical protein